MQNTQLSFNEQCYALLLKIPKGRVTTYKAVAQALNCKAYQAVGKAMNKNPNPIIVPCHRVVNANGQLGGYAFGKAQKRQQLAQEGIEMMGDYVVNFDAVFFDFTESCSTKKQAKQ